MKHIKSFRISEENVKSLKQISESYDRSEGWIANEALDNYFNSLAEFKIQSKLLLTKPLKSEKK